MKMIFSGLLSLVLLSGCPKGPAVKELPDAGVVLEKSVSILALGDSYTIGESVNQKLSFPFQLADSLRKDGIAVSDLKVIAKTGWTTGELMTAIADENLTRKFDWVTLLIGVNNQYRGYSQNEYRRQFVELLKTAIMFAGGERKKVVVISIPDWGATPFGGSGRNSEISKQIDAFNLINKEETIKFGVDYTDITPVSRKAVTDVSLVAGDGLHPSGKMYALWVHELLRSIK